MAILSAIPGPSTEKEEEAGGAGGLSQVPEVMGRSAGQVRDRKTLCQTVTPAGLHESCEGSGERRLGHEEEGLPGPEELARYYETCKGAWHLALLEGCHVICALSPCPSTARQVTP